MNKTKSLSVSLPHLPFIFFFSFASQKPPGQRTRRSSLKLAITNRLDGEELNQFLDLAIQQYFSPFFTQVPLTLKKNKYQNI